MKGRALLHERMIHGEIMNVKPDKRACVDTVRITDGDKLYHPYWTILGKQRRSFFIFDRKRDAIAHREEVCRRIRYFSTKVSTEGTD